MTLGNILVRPQLLDRGLNANEGRILDIFVELASRLIQDLINEGKLIPKISVAFERGAQNFIQHAGQNLDSAKPNLEAWFSPITDKANEGINQDFESVSGAINALTFLFDLLQDSLEQLHVEDIERKLNGLADILENDLGLTPSFFTDFINDLIDDIAEELTKDFLSGDQNSEALDAYIVGAHIITLKRIVLAHIDDMNLPTINLRDMIDAIGDALLSLNWDEEIDNLAEKLRPGTDTFEDLQTIFNLRLEASVEVNVADESVRTRSVSRGVDGEDCQMSWYLSWFNEKVTDVPDRLDIFNLDASIKASFINEDWAKFLEHLAHYLDAGVDIAAAFQHGFLDLKEGNKVSPSLNIGYLGVKSLITLFSYGHNGEGWIKYYKIYKDFGIFGKEDLDSLDFAEKYAKKGLKAFIKYLIKDQKLYQALLVLGGSFEQYPDHFCTWYANNFETDHKKAKKRSKWGEFAQKVLLSFFTLINQKGSGKNYNKIEGITKLFGEGLALATAAWWGKRQKYYKPKIDLPFKFFVDGDFWEFAGRVLLGGLFVTVGEWIGFLVAAGLSGKWSEEYYESIFSRIASPFFGAETFLKYAELLWEGNTDGGKAGLMITDTSEKKPLTTEVEFEGYPDYSNSPYLLPFDDSELVFCPTSNLSFKKHNYYDNLIYAYEFSPRYNSDVLAMRGGTVVAFNDSHLETSDKHTNYIVIRHDDESEGPIPNPDHDKREEGRPIVTCAWYRNGIQNSISQIFAAKGIPSSSIIGTKVKKGTPLMRSGRNSSNVNSLQVYVGEGEGVGEVRTIPWVFKDIKKKGKPKAFTYYRSQNEPVLPDHGLPIYHPHYHQSRSYGVFPVVSAEEDKVVIEGGIATEDFYEDLLVKYIRNGRAEVLLIEDSEFEYKDGQSTLELATNWEQAPAQNDQIEIIAGIRESGIEDGNAFVVLDPFASDDDDAYVGSHILITQLSENIPEDAHVNCKRKYIYRKIISYDGDDRRVEFDGGWENGCAPVAGSSYLIGAKPRENASEFQKLFGYWAPVDGSNQAIDFPDGTPFSKYPGLALYTLKQTTGIVQSGGVLAQSTLVLQADASATDNEYNNRFIIIRRDSKIIQYKQIASYTGASRTITINGTWDLALITGGAGGDTYEIGGATFTGASDEDKRGTYLAPDDPENTPSPDDFSDGKSPYKYWTYKVIR